MSKLLYLVLVAVVVAIVEAHAGTILNYCYYYYKQKYV